MLQRLAFLLFQQGEICQLRMYYCDMVTVSELPSVGTAICRFGTETTSNRGSTLVPRTGSRCPDPLLVSLAHSTTNDVRRGTITVPAPAPLA